LRFVAELLHATRPGPHADADTNRYVRYGASPRAGQAIVLSAKVRALFDARPSVCREDLEKSLLPSLRHRIVLAFDADADGRTVESLLRNWLATSGRRLH
jgi:MoxR-like ATPase